ncbi:unnamed protein product [Pleuronectes platessa]|uniref:Uncharacterized protein n=1 Tax=Pleuronectes platessa TaxID=8262 RepID=A0A9N7YBS9_PLEPL|nr:unnamed protein product [Pleuronectes platessa]
MAVQLLCVCLVSQDDPHDFTPCDTLFMLREGEEEWSGGGEIQIHQLHGGAGRGREGAREGGERGRLTDARLGILPSIERETRLCPGPFRQAPDPCLPSFNCRLEQGGVAREEEERLEPRALSDSPGQPIGSPSASAPLCSGGGRGRAGRLPKTRVRVGPVHKVISANGSARASLHWPIGERCEEGGVFGRFMYKTPNV